MIKGYSAEQIRAAEAPHLAAGEPLMLRAAAGLAAVIMEVLSRRGGPIGPEILMLVGPGNNGGDALFAGAVLAAEGLDVRIVPTASRMHADGLSAAIASGATVLHDRGQVASVAASSAVLVDGILGIGGSADPALRGAARDVVAALLPVVVAPNGPTVVAVDIPSGIGPDDGAVPDPVVLRADVTVTFGGVKAGLLLQPASALAGEVRLIDIGLSPQLDAVEPLLVRP